MAQWGQRSSCHFGGTGIENYYETRDILSTWQLEEKVVHLKGGCRSPVSIELGVGVHHFRLQGLIPGAGPVLRTPHPSSHPLPALDLQCPPALKHISRRNCNIHFTQHFINNILVPNGHLRGNVRFPCTLLTGVDLPELRKRWKKSTKPWSFSRRFFKTTGKWTLGFLTPLLLLLYHDSLEWRNNSKRMAFPCQISILWGFF